MEWMGNYRKLNLKKNTRPPSTKYLVWRKYKGEGDMSQIFKEDF